jgi:hypothetical protein
MTTTDATELSRNLFGLPEPGDQFAGLEDPASPEAHAVLAKIARKIGDTRRPGAMSDIPSGAVYLAQFVVHDLDFLTREGTQEGALLDLALIYGDGPRHDAYCYQVPAEPGCPRHLLRIGRARPTASSPAWGATRDLPRISCPNLDARAVETRSEVLVPNTFSDSNALLAQVQVLWALAHNAIASTLAETWSPLEAFEQARRINRGIYRDVVRADVLGAWLMPQFRDRYASAQPERLSHGPLHRAPREFMAGVGRLGHGLVREIYTLNDQVQVMGLRNLIRQTSTGRPHDMPLTEDWLVDFSRFFAIGSSVPQRARALGPHIARPFATGAGVGLDGSADGLVLRDLLACSRSEVRSVRSLVCRAESAAPRLFEGCFAQDERRWTAAVRDWLADTGLEPEEIDRLAADPPLSLFLMLEAEADTGGRTLGALGSVIMGETFAAALPAAEADAGLDGARAIVFRDTAPATMADLVRFLQRHYRFADGARLHPAEPDVPAATPAIRPKHGVTPMFDTHPPVKAPNPRIERAPGRRTRPSSPINSTASPWSRSGSRRSSSSRASSTR